MGSLFSGGCSRFFINTLKLIVWSGAGTPFGRETKKEWWLTPFSFSSHFSFFPRNKYGNKYIVTVFFSNIQYSKLSFWFIVNGVRPIFSFLGTKILETG